MIAKVTKAQLSILETKRERVRQLMRQIDAVVKEGEALLKIEAGDTNADGAYPAADYVGDFVGDAFAAEYSAVQLCEALGIEVAP